MRAYFSLEAMLVFVGVALFWIAIYAMVAPNLVEIQQKAREAELSSECEKMLAVIDTMATYGAESTYLDLTPYFQKSIDRGIYFCQDHQKCSSRNISAVLFKTGTRVQCTSHVAAWVDILKSGEVYSCSRIPEVGNFSVEFGSYLERGGYKECW